ncbi:MAG: nickel pincer cofactor biosynthesis protein LarC [Moorea sp. SIO2B7]|nr:nickel pincer cofactor biosynthesis protein LarC [Moorena sp. SIO2B7]
MKKIAYLQCPTGISGDMCLGALVDIGVPLEYLSGQLQSLGIEQEYRLRAEKVHRNSQLATKVHVDLLKDNSKNEEAHTFASAHAPSHHHKHHSTTRHLLDIEALIKSANLPPRASDWSLQVFRRLAIAEGAVHGIEPEKVHFHEVGATDAIVDIVGTCLGLDWLGIDQLYCSPMPMGGGIVKVAHGPLPVPVPAVLKLWESRQVPVYSNGIDKELVTPTGAAIAVTLATDFGSPPPLKLEAVGLGAGSANLPLPNVLRLWIGKDSGVKEDLSEGQTRDIVSVLETQIDDLSPQAIGYTFEALFKVGALDVFTQAIGMKKCRPGILLTVICTPEKVVACEEVLFRETTTLGIRHLTEQRTILQREIQQVETVYGTVGVKVASQGDGEKKRIINVQPEYEDCAQLARKYNQPWRFVHQMALAQWYGQDYNLLSEQGE